MRLAGAFFANHAEVVDDMLNVEGVFSATTAVPARAAGFQCNCVVLCDTRRRDVGTECTLHIDAAGPTGQRWAPAWSTQFQLPSAMKFMVLAQIALPIEVQRRAARLPLPVGSKPPAIRHSVGYRRRMTRRAGTKSRPGNRSLTTGHPIGFAKANRS
jgi:hypothetical protein